MHGQQNVKKYIILRVINYYLQRSVERTWIRLF